MKKVIFLMMFVMAASVASAGGEKKLLAEARKLPYLDLVKTESEKRNLDPALILTFMKLRSNLNPKFWGPKLMCGLTGFTESSFMMRGLDFKECFIPEKNIKIGMQIAEGLLKDEYLGDLKNDRQARLMMLMGGTTDFNELHPVLQAKVQVGMVLYKHYKKLFN